MIDETLKPERMSSSAEYRTANKQAFATVFQNASPKPGVECQVGVSQNVYIERHYKCTLVTSALAVFWLHVSQLMSAFSIFTMQPRQITWLQDNR